MNRICMLTALGVVLAIASMAPAAGIVNGSFESGLSGWSTSTTGNGSVQSVSNFEAWLPTDGNFFALLKTDAPHFLGSPFQLLYQTDTLNAGDQIAFDYFFDQDSLIFEDIAQVKLNGTTLLTLDNHTPSIEGQWAQFVTGPLPTTGAYTIEFGVADTSGLIQSAMGVDNVRVIPEPLTMLAVFSGISGLGVYLRRRRA